MVSASVALPEPLQLRRPGPLRDLQRACRKAEVTARDDVSRQRQADCNEAVGFADHSYLPSGSSQPRLRTGPFFLVDASVRGLLFFQLEIVLDAEHARHALCFDVCHVLVAFVRCDSFERCVPVLHDDVGWRVLLAARTG